MEKLLQLPREIQILISEYNLEHRKQFYWALKDIQNPSYCQTCDKLIKKDVYSYRNSDEICCSDSCLESIGRVTMLANGGRRILNYGNEDENIYIEPRTTYEYTNY